jgi:predicted small lipoprotein YifL
MKTAAVLLAVLALIACGKRPVEAPQAQRTETVDTEGLVIHQDRGTGCEYLRAPGKSGLTPRLGPDGKHVCK